MRLIAAFLSGIFAFTQVLFAHVPTLSVWESRRSSRTHTTDDRLARLMDTPAPLSAIAPAVSRPLPGSEPFHSAFTSNPAGAFLRLLPPDIVTVRDLVVPTAPKGPLAGRRFIVVQDVHLNADAQRNIADLLIRLMGAGQAGIVAVEGAVGGFDLARFRNYPDASVTEAVARAFLLSDRIGAPSFAGITSKSTPPVFWGVDDAEHYDRNVDAYRAGIKNRPAAKEAVLAEARDLAAAKRIAFTPELTTLDAAAASYESGETGLGDHLEFLSRIGALSLLPAEQASVTDRFLEAWRIERRLDFDRADRERRSALETLVSKLSKVEIDSLVALSLGYREGRIAFGDYHRAISNLIVSKGVSLDNLPAFKSYLRYVLLSDGINADLLLASTGAAQKMAFDRAASTLEQRRLVAASRHLTLKKKLLEFALTPSEWSEYESGGTEPSLASFEDFYREAHVRSEKIVENLAAAARRTDGGKVSVLVVGGFHAPDVVKRLAEMGASYAIVSPKLAKVDAASGTAYLSVFSREKTPLQKLFEGEKLFVYPAHLDIGAVGVHTAAANDEFEADQILTGKIRAGQLDRGLAKATVSGRDYAAVPAGARVPFGYSAVKGAVEPIDRSPVQFVRRTSIGALLAASPLQMTGWFSRLAQWFGLSKEAAARLSFLEELLYTGLLVYALPWALVSLGAVPVSALDWLRPVMFGLSAVAFAISHPKTSTWSKDGKIEQRPATVGSYAASLVIGVLFRSAFFFGFGPGVVIGVALIGHAAWNNLLAPVFRFLPVMMTTVRAPLWWQHADRKFVAMSVPIYALRRDPASDPGIGKFTDLGRSYREKLRPQGVDVVLLLPHYATLDESPYAPVSLFAVQERYIDWAQVPEVAADARLAASLVAPVGEQDEINYTALGVREDRVAEEAFRRFQSSIRVDTERAQSYALFLRQNRGWLREYADFMAIHTILGKSSVDWTDAEVANVRLSPRYQQLYDLHSYKQWIGYRQFAAALNEVQAAGGHVLIDIPFFRGKDSVSVRNNPQYFRDPKNRSAGIRNANTDQTWGDLALWNWPELAQGSYDYVLGPIRHWLRFGVDGGRNDATHFYYRIGQFGENDEPGDAVVSRLASTFHQYGALPVAEAFENKGDEVARHGIVVVDGNWQRVSTHDDGARPHLNDPVNFVKDLLGRLFRSGDPRTSQFIAYTLGDLDGDPRTVKRMEDGRSLWRYRQSLAPARDLGRAIRFYRQTLPELRATGRRIWDAAVELRDMFESATESFVKHPEGRVEIWAASRDWFAEQWGRDTFIALPGILLSTRRFDQARELIRGFARYERNGLIPNRIWDPNNPASIEYNTSDASMWFIQSIKSYVEATGDTAFLAEMAPVMRRIMQGYIHGTGWDGGKHINDDPALNDRRISMDPADGLINVPGQSTWMDADPHGQGAVTPRNGKPVEINALWYSNLRFMSQALAGVDDARAEAAEYTRIAEQVKVSFNATFWNDHAPESAPGSKENALYDMAPGGPHNGAIRPNMLFAISHGGDLLSPERQAMVFARAEADLWTPFGPRTLSPRDSNYRSRYETGRQPYPGEADFPNHKDYAYHQGTVWPWLIGTYVDSLVKVRLAQGRSMPQIQDELRNLLEPIVNQFAEQGSLHEVYDGSPRMEDGRQHPGGTSSQAWSVAEVYRVLAQYGVLAAPVSAPHDWIAENAPAVAGKTVVEVTMEMALPGAAFDAMEALGIDHQTQVNAAMATSTGGIGPLLKERVIALGDLGANVVAFSLLYEHVWVQRIEKGVDGNPDTIHQEKVEIGSAFRKILIDAGDVDVTMFDGSVAKVKVWRAPDGMFGKATVYYFDYPKIADVVYPGNADGAGLSEVMRLAQNWMVGRGSLAMLKKIDRKPDITVMSEMPSTLSFHRLVDDEFTHDPFFKDTQYVFNDHTPLEYAHPKWDAGVRERMRLRPMFYENQDLKVGDKVVGTAMIINAADAVYGVAKKHGDVMRAMAHLRQFADKIQSVTNGVSSSYWPTDEFRDAARAVALSDDEIARVKTRRRNELLRYLGEREGMPEGWADRMIAAGHSVGIWTRRVVGYKRMDVFASLIENDAMRERFLASGIIFVLGGRIHQDDPYGLNQFARIQAVMQRDPRLKDRVIFFENYNILDAPHLFRGADFSVMLADDGYEASATGFQKAQMNGDLIIASHDGAVPESVTFAQRDAANANGFEVPYVRVDPDPTHAMSPTPEGLMDAFSMFATAHANPPVYARMVRNALLAAPRVDVVRTAKDMLKLLDRALQDKAAEDRDYADGHQIAETYFSGKTYSAGEAQRMLGQLGAADPFDWKYKEQGVTERTLYNGKNGVQGFLDGYHHVLELGTVGDWSLLNHAQHVGGRGDVIVHLSAAFSAVPDLGVRLLLDDLAERARLAATDHDKLRLTRIAVGLAERSMERLAVSAQTSPAVAPGLVGAWKGSRLGMEMKSGIEGAIIGVAALGVVIVAILALSAGAPVHTASDGALMALLASILSALFVGAVILTAHLRLGVLQPNDTVVRDTAIAVRASIAAASSLLSIPFFANGVMLLKLGAISPSNATVIILIGLAVAVIAHIATNRRILSGINGENVVTANAQLSPVRVPAKPGRNEARYDRPVPLGLLGVWGYFPRMTYGVASVIESLSITVIAVFVLLLVVHGLAADSVLTNLTMWNLAQESARITLLIVAVVFPTMMFMHLVFGVMQPGAERRPIWGWGISLRATAVAMSSLVGLPLIVMASVAWRTGVNMSAVGILPMAITGIVLGAIAHRAFNTRLLDWYAHRHPRGQQDLVLNAAIRQRLVENSQVLINFLAERNVTEVGDDVMRLRHRGISSLPEGVVHSISDHWEKDPVDVMVILGSHYLDVPVRAARLYYHLRQTNPNLIVVFAGGMGPRTQLRFPYWTSEAELFRDRFMTSYRMVRRLSLERRFRLAAHEAMGRYTGVFVQLVLLIDDILHGSVHTAPSAVFLETQSTNTGANIQNVTQIFRSHNLQPQNILLVTADVFQLRARASWLQQYGLPMTRVYSWAANRTDLSRVSDHDVIELADEAHSQIDRLQSYAVASPKPFTIPVPIPENVLQADSHVREVLEQTNLLGFSRTSPDEKKVRRYPASFLNAFAVILVILGTIAVVPGKADSAIWQSLTMSSLAIASHAMASLLLGATVFVGLFSRSVGSFHEARVRGWMKPFAKFLRLALPPISAILYLASSVHLVPVIPVWISAFVTITLGAILRSWSMSVERTREQEREFAEDAHDATPGAAGFWARTGLSLKSIGVIEGALTAAVALTAMGVVMAVALLAPNALHISSIEAFFALTVAGLSAGALVINQIHRRFGVTVRPGTPPSFDRPVIGRAIRTAYLSLLGIPLLAAGLLLPALPAAIVFAAGLLISIVPHASKNAKADRAHQALDADDLAQAGRTAALLHELNEARKVTDDARLAAALAALTSLERLNLDAFGRETALAVRDDAQVAYQLATNQGAYASWQYALTAAQQRRGTYTAGTVGTFVSDSAGQPASAQEQNRRDHIAIVAVGVREAELTSETEHALTVADGHPLTVILTGEGQNLADTLGRTFASRGVTFVRQSELSSASAIENTLLGPALRDAGHLKLLINRDAGIPDFLVGPLLELGRQDRYRDLVELVIVTALANGAFAVRASLSDIERAITFRDLVLSQA